MNSNKVDLSVRIGNLVLPNPILTASGCTEYGEKVSPFYSPSIPGGFVVKGTTLNPKSGNEQPRIVETDSGMINRIGLENPGLDVVINEKIPWLAQQGARIIINISGDSRSDYVEMAQRLNDIPEVLAIEINVSCPNIHSGGLPFGKDQSVVYDLVYECKRVTSKTLIVKLTPMVSNITKIATAAMDAGAHGISLINTIPASFIHNGKLVSGGLSGPAIRPVALKLVSELGLVSKDEDQKFNLPIIGIGGIETLEDVLDFISVGAHAVAVGTATFKNPTLIPELIKQLEEYCIAKGIESLDEIQGSAL